LLPKQNLIGGQWVDAQSGETIAVTDPGTDAILAEVPRGGHADFDAAIDAASVAFADWRDRTARDRGKILQKLCALVEAEAETLARTISSESGKPLTEALAEVAYGAGFLEWAAEEAKRVYGETVPSSRPEQRILVLRKPVGVTAAITPWNFPLAMLTRKLGPALAVGCTQIVKPASQTPLTALALAQLACEAGVPPGVLNVVTGSGAAFARTIFGDSRVRKVSFTGSTEVGQDLVRQSASTLARLSLELGGHAPVVVLEDADLPTAVAQTLRAKFRNGGQSCIAANRIYVARSLYEDFASEFAMAAQSMKVDHWTRSPDIGPLIDDEGVTKALSHVEDAGKRGAKLVAGGGLRDLGPGYTRRFVEPTVLQGVPDDSLMSCEETFGPVAGIAAFDDETEAITRANSSPYGLAAYVFGRDYGRIRRVTENLDYGVIGVNDGVPSTAQAPFGGMKMSGFGREGGHYVMGEYLDVKYVSLVSEEEP
jgi:succinate-semialdehyde dehydrogenase/glutarate-semialdehyde dehydrogenase